MSTNVNDIGQKFILALFHVQCNFAKPWTAEALLLTCWSPNTWEQQTKVIRVQVDQYLKATVLF